MQEQDENAVTMKEVMVYLCIHAYKGADTWLCIQVQDKNAVAMMYLCMYAYGVADTWLCIQVQDKNAVTMEEAMKKRKLLKVKREKKKSKQRKMQKGKR
jgi:hypothetical protein